VTLSTVGVTLKLWQFNGRNNGLITGFNGAKTNACLACQWFAQSLASSSLGIIRPLSAKTESYWP
jgi:hypothetical protein